MVTCVLCGVSRMKSVMYSFFGWGYYCGLSARCVKASIVLDTHNAVMAGREENC